MNRASRRGGTVDIPDRFLLGDKVGLLIGPEFEGSLPASNLCPAIAIVSPVGLTPAGAAGSRPGWAGIHPLPFLRRARLGSFITGKEVPRDVNRGGSASDVAPADDVSIAGFHGDAAAE